MKKTLLINPKKHLTIRKSVKTSQELTFISHSDEI